MSFILGTTTLVFLLLVLAGRILTVLELRSLEQQYRRNLRHISDLDETLDTSRRKYLVGLKAEGVSKQKLAHLKTRLVNATQHLEQIENTAAEQREREQQELEHSLEVIVMKALGGPSARRDSHFKRVMKVIKDLIDLEKQSNSEEVIAVVQQKLAEMMRTGDLDAAADAGPPPSSAATPPSPDPAPPEPPPSSAVPGPQTTQAPEDNQHPGGDRGPQQDDAP